jgi:hypothetical protein
MREKTSSSVSQPQDPVEIGVSTIETGRQIDAPQADFGGFDRSQQLEIVPFDHRSA